MWNFFEREKRQKKALTFGEREMIRCSEWGWTCIYRKRKRAFCTKSSEREREKNSKSCFFFSSFFQWRERMCVVGILASLCLSINFILFNFILVYLFPVCSTRHWKTVLGDLGVDFGKCQRGVTLHTRL